MNSRLIIFLFLVFFVQDLYAGDGEYAVSRIPAELMKSANVVKRREEFRFEILDIGKATLYQKYVITILNANGDEYARLSEYYDKLRTIESIAGTLFDAYGKKIKSLRKSDIEDMSGSSSGNLIDDDRLKYHNFYCKVYPYTVEYEVEYKYNFTMFFPSWVPQENEFYTVEQSKMTFICPSGYKFRYKALNYSASPQILTVKNRSYYSWEVENLKAIKLEYGDPQWEEITPKLYLGPDLFEVEGYKGDMQSWNEFGKLIYALKAGKDQLPEETKIKVHQLADGLSDKRQKIRTLYEYMQQNTRYVSIQLGIGGWQPFDATYVANKKYGDCKALSNFMYSLLKEVGITSYYTLIQGGRDAKYFVKDFPSSQFNHVILCVPLEKDTVWLECTDQDISAGYLGSFTEDRNALLIDESGGTLVRTPKYNGEDNLASRKIVATVNIEGNLEAAVVTRYRALTQDHLESLVSHNSKDKIHEYLKSAFYLPTYDVTKFEYQQEKSALPVIVEQLGLTASNYAQVSGRRIFINPNILNRSHIRLEVEDDRKYPVQLNNEFRNIDSVEIAIPAGFSTESLPPDANIDSEFGKYFASTKFSANRIMYIRKFEVYAGKFPAKDYSALVKFYEEIYHADHRQVVLIKNL